MGNQLTERAKIAKVTTTMEGLVALRTDVMKKSALGKPVNIRDYIQIYKLPSMFTSHLGKTRCYKR